MVVVVVVVVVVVERCGVEGNLGTFDGGYTIISGLCESFKNDILNALFTTVVHSFQQHSAMVHIKQLENRITNISIQKSIEPLFRGW